MTAVRKAEARSKYGDELIDWLESATADDMEFVRSVANRFAMNGKLSDKQAAALEKVRAKRADWAKDRSVKDAEWKAKADDVVPGRYLVEGEVLSAKFKPTQYGEALKILVLSDGRAEKLYGNAPKNLAETYGTDLKGQHVEFVATVKATNDKGFGVFSHAKYGAVSAPPSAIMLDAAEMPVDPPEAATTSAPDREPGTLCHDCLEIVGEGCECS